MVGIVGTAGLAAVLLAAVLIGAAGGNLWLWLAQLPRDVLLAGGWLAAAWGWGWIVLALVARTAETRTDTSRTNRAATDGPRPALQPLTLPIGAALLLTLDGAGLRITAGPAVVWGLQLVGVAGALAAVAAWPQALRRPPLAGDEAVTAARPPRDRLAGATTLVGLGLAVVAAAVLLAAAGSPPGWLWASEFDGYDVMSYHLQLPLEWMAAGRSAPLPHNAYSWMPNGLEHVSLHLGTLAGDVRAAATAAQLLHASLAVAAAMTAAGLVRDLGGRLAGAAATGALVVGTPWVVVTGSLAYTEMMVLWMLAASMRLTERAAVRGEARRAGDGVGPGLEGAVHGALLAAACAAKLTAGPLAAIPAAAWWLAIRGWPGPRRMSAIAASAAIAGALTLAPWWISNLVHAGNPVFPFATSTFGAGPWTDEQVAAWNAGHRAGGTPTDIWSQWLDPLGVPGHRSETAADDAVDGAAGADTAARTAASDDIDGRRTGQWALLPWIGLLGLAALLARCFTSVATARESTADAPATVDPRRVAIGAGAALAIQLLAWLTLTHAEARFLLPTVIPAAVAGGLLLGRAVDVAQRGHRLARAVVLFGLLATAAGPAFTVRLWFAQRGGDAAAAVGQADVLAGQAHDQAIRAARTAGDRALERDLLDSAPPSWWINHALPEARILLIGEAAPFWLATDRVTYRTVWDRGPLSRWLDAADAGTDARPWTARALADGFTHVLVDQPMLENWSRRGWNDPRITWEALVARTDAGALVPRRTFANRGQTLYRLAPDSAAE